MVLDTSAILAVLLDEPELKTGAGSVPWRSASPPSKKTIAWRVPEMLRAADRALSDACTS